MCLSDTLLLGHGFRHCRLWRALIGIVATCLAVERKKPGQWLSLCCGFRHDGLMGPLKNLAYRSLGELAKLSQASDFVIVKKAARRALIHLFVRQNYWRYIADVLAGRSDTFGVFIRPGLCFKV